MHEGFIRQAIALAIAAGKKGNATFGAVLVHQGQVIATAENSELTDDGYGHAEYNLAIKAATKCSDKVLAASTLYSSCTPCLRCTCAIVAVGIPRIVYSVGFEAFASLIPEPYTVLSCGEVVSRLNLTHVEIIGPVLEDEGMLAFEYWGGEHTPLTDMLDHARQARRRNSI